MRALTALPLRIWLPVAVILMAFVSIPFVYEASSSFEFSSPKKAIPVYRVEANKQRSLPLVANANASSTRTRAAAAPRAALKPELEGEKRPESREADQAQPTGNDAAQVHTKLQVAGGGLAAARVEAAVHLRGQAGKSKSVRPRGRVRPQPRVKDTESEGAVPAAQQAKLRSAVRPA